MRDIVLWSRAIDRKILVCMGVVASLVSAALIGSALPEAGPFDWISPFNSFLGVVLLVLAWLMFRIFKPSRYSRKWTVAEAIAVPVLWAVLLIALGCWFAHLRDSDPEYRMREELMLQAA